MISRLALLSIFLCANQLNHAFAEEHDDKLRIGAQSQYFDYKEEFPSPGKSEERGVITGISLGYEYKPQSQSSWSELELNYTSGVISYDGSLQNMSTGAYAGTFVDKSQLKLFELLSLLGASLHRTPISDLGIYAGLYLRTWDRILGINQPQYGYEEIYSSLFLPIGIRYEHQVSERINLGLDAAVHIPISSAFKMLHSSFTISNSLKTEISGRVKAHLQYSFNEKYSIKVSPFIQTVKYKASYIGLGFSEPSSKTLQYGSQLHFVANL